ncbi:hypothetical protein K2Z83_04545 [Oscillochloris sp. ZM17-4]|uniref:hypothetical protein n=1 Tax=Oscillochloris sp. ZM17-4 TaxID=2866714 RepID=UPI001C73B56B|nr:hypothetical protein [Oscillochloris sp. ZM17-4]MBX0326950.1 hypothetical protein [Oscillochloris sp. ZM17-4]
MTAIRWKLVFERTIAALFYLSWGLLGLVALASVGLMSPYLGSLARWRVLDLLMWLGVAGRDQQIVVVFLVLIQSIIRQMIGLGRQFMPEDE